LKLIFLIVSRAASLLDYLPTRPSTAAGVAFGLSVSVGGLFMPLLGLVADHSGPRGVFVVLALIPLIAVAISTALREPASGRALLAARGRGLLAKRGVHADCLQ
jgi:FSR family fosmidomycin resistance protein-like MFS transporter